MPSLLRRSTFAAVLVTGAALFAAGVQGLAGMETSLQLAADRTEPREQLVRYSEPDPWCDDHLAGERI